MTEDAESRIPVVIGQTLHARAGDYVLDIGLQAAPVGHPAQCSCCAPRSTVGRLLGELFVARARAEVFPFARILLAGADASTVEAAIEADVLARARYRFSGPA